MSQLFPSKIPLLLKIFLGFLYVKAASLIVTWLASVVYIFSSGGVGGEVLKQFLMGVYGGDVLTLGPDPYYILGQVMVVLAIPFMIDALTIFSLWQRKYKTFLVALFIQVITRLISLTSPFYILIFIISLLSKNIRNYFNDML